MNMTFKMGYDTSDQDLLRLLELDQKLFGADVISNPGYALQRYRKNPEGLIVAYDKETFAGGSFIFPVTRSLKEKIYLMEEEFDDNIPPEEVLPFQKDAENHIFYLDIVVDESYRNCGLAELMLSTLMLMIQGKQRQGYPIAEVFGLTVSDGGLAVAKNSLGAEMLQQANGCSLIEIKGEALKKRCFHGITTKL